MGNANKDENRPGFGERAGTFFFNKVGFRLAATGMMALMAWYAQAKSVTIAEFNAAYASIPLVGIILALVFDYGLDTGKLYNRMLGRGKSGLSKLAFAFGAVFVFFMTFTWLLAGTITLNLATITPATLVASALVALIVLLPNTGTSEWLLWLWIAETIVTGGAHLTIFPAIKLLNMALTVLLGGGVLG
ncbi:hypothetical protein X802_00915 [Thermococcus guaymasensis DSM 11113]|uniref:Uncharacterized protein n=1 Tax=Thermococcus guaymasensis DSM 11113 TaxID=1432656 RepID=A0A0X1KI16_9EURY|nr:hypothetical protein [Thermococcus guaymasensis]AJC70911.1 hypothetical protein X802_00915 [Thermococcus guaymasensis DSM 11113]